MDWKKQIHDSVTESVGRNLYFADQVKLGNEPTSTDAWLDKYHGRDFDITNKVLNFDTFRPRVQALTSHILQEIFPIIDKAIASEINDHMKKHFE